MANLSGYPNTPFIGDGESNSDIGAMLQGLNENTSI